MVFPLISGCNEFTFIRYMNTRSHRFLLFFVALALAVAPLRGAFASLAMDAGDPESHCARMLDSAQSGDPMAGMHDQATDNSGHGQGCGGDCCDGTCNACAHGMIALTAPIPVMTGVLHISLLRTVSRSFTGRTVHPPFRPPISLRG